MQVIQPPMTDEQVEALRQRNAERARVAIEQLGAAWVLYKRPAHKTGAAILRDVMRSGMTADRMATTLRSKRA